jgi:hypothetical protein
MADTRNIPRNNAQQGDTQNERNASPRDQEGDGDQNCGQSRQLKDIKPHMEVISSCGCTMGKVDHLEGNAIKLTRNDSPDGQHHFIPTNWVEKVDNHIHLKRNAEDTLKEWKTDAASCSNCGA